MRVPHMSNTCHVIVTVVMTARRPVNGSKQGTLRKGWCVITNNYTEVSEKEFDRSDVFEYAIFGRELAPTTVTPHLQGYVHLFEKKRFSFVQPLFPNSKIIPADGSASQNRVYSTKTGDFVEYGSCPLDGPATVKKDWEAAKNLAIAGRLEDIPGNIYVPHYNTLKTIVNDHLIMPVSRSELVDEWHYGPTGCGKSRPIREGNPLAYVKNCNEWWTGYKGEEVVIVEDIDKYDVKMGGEIKRWCDHYPFAAQMKHQSDRMIRPKKIIFTSNYHPSDIWSDDKTAGPILRRCKIVEYGRDTTSLTVQQNLYNVIRHHDFDTQII